MRRAEEKATIISATSLQIVILGLLCIWILGLLMAPPAAAMRNPTAVYCSALGYKYHSAHTKRGVIGLCELPDNRLVNALDFFRGKVALEWSYCLTQGYEAKRVESGESGHPCRDCLVCVLPNGEEVWVVKLMGLSFRESFCGDGQCDTAIENYIRCPQDCPSGGPDGLCDGVADGRCDPDCAGLGQYDPDCGSLFVDIKPGSCPNPINVKDKGVLPVAILGTPGFDVARSIDPKTIRLTREGIEEMVPPLRWAYEDVSTPYQAGDCGCPTSQGDGIADLTLKFDSEKLVKVLRLADVKGETVQLIVTGNLYDGTPVRGRDCVKILK